MSNIRLTLKTCFILALASAKKISELHGPLHDMKLRRMVFYLLFVLGFVVKTQNSTITDLRFEEFAISLSKGLCREEILFCLVGAMKHCLARLEQH